MIYELAILDMLRQQPACWIEQPDPTRDSRLVMVAHELAQLPKSVALPLAYQGWKESRWCKYVGEGCVEIPKGASGNCDKGTSRGYWQEKENTCRDAYRYAPATIESLHEEVQCAARIWRNGLRRCEGRNEAGNIAGAFANFSGVGCTWSGGAARAQEYDAMLQRFLRIKAKP